MEETSIYRYLTGRATKEEEETLLNWLKASPENRQIFFELKTIWNIRSGFNGGDASQSMQHSLDLVNKRIHAENKNTLKQTVKKHILLWSSIAALFSLILFYITNNVIRPVTSVLYTYTNMNVDSVKQIVLDDGTSIWLNYKASLTCPQPFSGNERLVELSGNAFFEVIRDTLHPFIVITDSYRIKVLGTSFSVNTNHSKGRGETVLLEGAVELEEKTGESVVVLHPGQQVLYSKDFKEMRINEIDVRQHTLWRFGLVSISNISIEDIITCIEDTFQVKIQMDITNLTQRRYNFSFKRSNGPEEAVKQIYYLTGRNATIEY